MYKITAGLLVVSLAANIALLFERHKNQDYYARRPNVRSFEKPYADMALKANAAENFTSVRKTENYFYPAAINLEDRVCIQLKPLVGVLGEAHTYCYRKDTKERKGVAFE